MYLHSSSGKPILIDSESEKKIYNHDFSDIPLNLRFDPDDIEMVAGDKRIIGNLLTGVPPKSDGKRIPYDKARAKLEKLSQAKMTIPGAQLIPFVGAGSWDPPIYITGATGSGKSTIATKIIQHDAKNRPVYLFTNHETADPSLQPIWKRIKKVVLRHPIQSEIEEIPWNKVELDNSIALFDDIGSNQDFKELRDQLLEEGRHHNICVIVVDHGIRPNRHNKKCYEECRTVVFFPFSNLPSITKILERYYDLPARIRRKVIENSVKDGRYLIYHQASPIFVATAQTCHLLHPLLNT